MDYIHNSYKGMKQIVKALILVLFFAFTKSWGQTTVFSENMGTGASGNPSVVTYNGYQNFGTLTFSGTGDVRNNTASSVYAGASGGNNVFLTNNSSKTFQICGINSSACSSFTLSFGIWKSSGTTSTGELQVQFSNDGGSTFGAATSLTITGGSTWSLQTITSGISSGANICIKFTNTSTTVQFRIDDVVLKGNCTAGCVAPTISTQPTSVSTNTSGTATYTVAAGGTSLTYQWLESTGGAFTNITNGGSNPTYAGATSSVLTISNPPLSMSSYSYQCVVTNACGNASTNGSSTITVTSSSAVPSSCTVNGAMGTGYTSGCGAGVSACNLASVYSSFGTFCGASAVTCGTCPNTNVSSTYNFESGCTATITAEYKARTISGSNCSNSAMDSGDQISITNSGGSVSVQTSTMDVTVTTCATYPSLGTYTTSTSSLATGCGNSDGTVKMIITGGAVTIAGTMNRGDEILTYTINASGTCSLCPMLLPVGFVDFYGIKEEDKNVIYWKVENEENIEFYMIEKSNDGMNFEHFGIQQVDYKSPSHIKSYSMADNAPYSDITYYRISVREHYGVTKIYNIIYLDRTTYLDWNTKHYQLDQNLVIEFKNSIPRNSSVELYDLSGRLLYEESIKNFQTIINTQTFEVGVYFVRIQSPYKTENYKIIIDEK